MGDHTTLSTFDVFAKELMVAWEEEDDMLLSLYVSNNTILSQYMEEDDQPKRKGSVPGHIVINRGREQGHAKLWWDYFSENPTYGEPFFSRRFRMRRPLFLKIVDAVKAHDKFFIQKRDGIGRLGLSTLQKITSAFRVLAYGTPTDSTDEIMRIGESTSILCVKRFCRAIVDVFGKKYLRSPNANDVARLLKKGEERGFPGMLGSLDCMHWAWKNCPTAWAGQYSGRSGSPTIILEAVASYDLWIWHAYFGLPGSNNDINVLDSSNLFADLTQGIAPPANYTIGGIEFNIGYYLADGIYPKWSTLVQSVTKPDDPKKKHFAMMQEACRKDVERAFGVIQAKFAIVKGPARFWNKRVLHDIMSTCIIMHNMIIEDEREENMDAENVVSSSTIPNAENMDADDTFSPIPNAENMDVDDTPSPITNAESVPNETGKFQKFLAQHRKIKNKEEHYKLRNALIRHLWERLGNTSI